MSNPSHMPQHQSSIEVAAHVDSSGAQRSCVHCAGALDICQALGVRRALTSSEPGIACDWTAARLSLRVTGAEAVCWHLGASPLGASAMLRAGEGCRAGVSGSTGTEGMGSMGTEGVGEWYTALWPTRHMLGDPLPAAQRGSGVLGRVRVPPWKLFVRLSQASVQSHFHIRAHTRR